LLIYITVAVLCFIGRNILFIIKSYRSCCHQKLTNKIKPPIEILVEGRVFWDNFGWYVFIIVKYTHTHTMHMHTLLYLIPYKCKKFYIDCSHRNKNNKQREAATVAVKLLFLVQSSYTGADLRGWGLKPQLPFNFGLHLNNVL